MVNGQIKARLRRIKSIHDFAEKITDKKWEQAINKRHKIALEDILIDKHEFFNRLWKLGVTEKKLEEYFSIWKDKGSFKEVKSGRFKGKFYLSKTFNNLPKEEQQRLEDSFFEEKTVHIKKA